MNFVESSEFYNLTFCFVNFFCFSMPVGSIEVNSLAGIFGRPIIIITTTPSISSNFINFNKFQQSLKYAEILRGWPFFPHWLFQLKTGDLLFNDKKMISDGRHSIWIKNSNLNLQKNSINIVKAFNK